jgi:cellulose synthase/poly-beta-1,6-N-acetylglucosamine synthase-like glycosyltransferase
MHDNPPETSSNPATEDTRPLRISVIICTWNRSDLLVRTLAQMTELEEPESEWELIVVDNNCTDDTPAVLSRFADRLPLTVVEEKTPGLSNARNAGLAVADCDYVVWTDDDVLVDPHWLRAYEDAFRRYPDAAFFGGPIRPFMDQEAPEWFDTALHDMGAGFMWAVLDLGPDEIPLGGGRLPFGANMAYRRADLPESPFDPRLGRMEDQLLAGEETALMGYLADLGMEGRWIPSATVEHYVPGDSLTLDYVRRWWVGHGKAQAALKAPSGRISLAGIPSWLATEYLRHEALLRWYQLRNDPIKMLPHLARRCELLGLILGTRERAEPRS